MVLVYLIGIPLFYLISLIAYKHKINPKSILVVPEAEVKYVKEKVIAQKKMELRNTYTEIQMLTFLYDNYTPQCWYFEVIECMKRLIVGTLPVVIMRQTVSQVIAH